MYEDARDSPCYYCFGFNDYTFYPRVYGKNGFGYAQKAYYSRYNPLVCKRSDLVSKEELRLMDFSHASDIRGFEFNRENLTTEYTN
jgi:hypothetical protein